jgi:4-carboxymuconolactone decarboxylase
MPRLAPLDLDRLTPDQQRVADAIRSGPRGGLRGPFEAWLRAPGFAEHAQLVGAYCRFGSSLAPDVRELAILLAGKHWRAQYEFWAHARIGREAGLGDAVIEAVRTGGPPPFQHDAQRDAYDFVTECFATRRVSDATYARALATFGERGVMDLVGVVGYYGMVSMTLNVFEVALPDGVPEPLP